MKHKQTSHTESLFKSTEFWLAMIFVAGSIFFFTRPADKPLQQENSEQINKIVTTSTPQSILKSSNLEQPTQQKNIIVKVRYGDTFWQLAQKHCGSHRFAESIATANGYSDVRRLREGDTLSIACALK